jgi:NAD(P)-dependent dehydrogenase (short-subunit alcohol dehydrogenase family)
MEGMSLTDSKHIKPKAVSALSTGELEGKTALVTGGGGVIGPAYARALAEAGAAVALVDIDAGKAQRAAKKLCDDGFKVQGWQADVGVKADIEAAVSDAQNVLGGIDILINNAGYATTMDFEDISEAEFDKVLNANLKGAFFVSQVCVPHMKEKGWGRIVNLTSTVSKIGPGDLPHYVATKTGVIGLTRSLARALGKHGITVNALAPGMVATEPIIALYPESALDNHAARRSIKRWEYAEDLVGPLTYYCSKHADFVTGQTMLVDGGQQFD